MTTFAHVQCDHGSPCKGRILSWAREHFGDVKVAFQKNRTRFMVHRTGCNRRTIRNVRCDDLDVEFTPQLTSPRRAVKEPVLDESKLWYINSRTRTVPIERAVEVLQGLGGSARATEVLRSEPGLLKHLRTLSSGERSNVAVSNDNKGYVVYTLV